MKKLDLSNVEEPKDFAKLVAGGYIAKITKVTDVPEKEYLKIEYDICEGEFKNYWSELFASRNFWGGSFIRSYKETAQSFFKQFINTVQESNEKFVFDYDEQKLVGKKVGIVLGEEDYIGNDGAEKTRVRVASTKTVKQIKAEDFTVPAHKLLPPTAEAVADFASIPDGIAEELPFN